MAHFSQIDSDNNVIHVTVVNNDILLGDGGPGDEETEAYGISHLKNLFGADKNWVQTSCNTYIDENGERQHLRGGTPFRKRYGAIGLKWYPDRQEFDLP